MSNNKQTSVEQLFHKLWDEPKDKFTWYVILKEHMAMHKQEITQAWKKGDGQFDKVSNKISLEYYEKTYGGNDE